MTSLLFFVVASFCMVCRGSERDVFLHIFDKYDNRIRPVKETNTTTYVGTQFQIISLLEVNGQQEYVKMAAFFKLNWTDEYLTWNPADFGGTEYIRAPAKDVWTPNFAIVTTRYFAALIALITAEFE
uniref:Neurotransmitter-gated ion-channel ligand-binding domain-containing protein n=1 Tax=Plectus sambesii TaxID=2011161 RepID=A0A914WMX4_9BILA